MKYVLLTDSDNGCALISCRDDSEAERIGAAAVWASAGMSAWLVPDLAIVASDELYDQLVAGHDTSALDGDRVAVKVLLAGGEIR